MKSTQRILTRPAGQFAAFKASSHALVRPRLQSLLGGAESRRLTLIIADSGYGKTTVLAQWGSTLAPIPQAWYSLRSADGVARTFERHLVAALASVAALHRPVRTMEDALDSLEQDALIVLDDLQHASDEGTETLKNLLEHPRLHLVLASRVPPALPLARLRLQGQVVELTAADLAFTHDEVLAIGLEGDPAELLRQTQGWPAAFALIRFGGSLQSAGSRKELFSLLAEEVWSRLSAEERSLLEYAAVAGTVSAEMTRDLSENPGTDSLLDGFSRRGWLSVTASDRYQCHSLVHDFVLERMPSADRAALAGRVVQWLLDRGQPEEAGGISALCTTEARRQFLKLYGTLVTRSGGASALREALETLPFDPNEPAEVTTLRGRLHNLEGAFAEGLEWLKKAQEQAFWQENWTFLARAAAYEAEIFAHRGENAKAVLACRGAIARINGRNEDARAELEGLMAWSLFHLGKVDEAMATLERARAWFEQRGNTQHESILIRRRGAIHSMLGELSEALRWESLALARFRQIREPLGEANVCMNLAATLGRAGRFDEALIQGQTALAIAERHGLTGMVQQIRLALAVLSAEVSGEIGAIPTGLESERDLFQWNVLAARVARRRGEPNKAWQALGAARALVPQLNPAYRFRLDVEEGVLLLVQEDVEAALRILEPAVEAMWQGPWRVESYLPRLHRAFGRLRTHQQEGARADLAILLEWRTQADLGSLWAPEAWAAIPLLEMAIQTRLEKGFASSLLQRLGAVPQVIGQPPIRVQILGPLRVIRDSTELEEGAFERPQVRGLLAYLALRHPRSVPATEIVETLWPGAASIEESSLYTTVSRLRRALGRDAVIKDGTGYRLSAGVEVDTAAFDRALAAQPPRWKDAVALWRGELLADLPLAEWCFLARETYRNRMLEAATRYGESSLAQKDYEAAKQTFERALEIDAFCEPAVQGLMRVLVLTGNAPRALRLFQRFMQTLQRELGLVPSEETLQLAQRLAG